MPKLNLDNKECLLLHQGFFYCCSLSGNQYLCIMSTFSRLSLPSLKSHFDQKFCALISQHLQARNCKLNIYLAMYILRTRFVVSFRYHVRLDGGGPITKNSSAAVIIARLVSSISTRAVVTAAIIINAYLGKNLHMVSLYEISAHVIYCCKSPVRRNIASFKKVQRIPSFLVLPL